MASKYGVTYNVDMVFCIDATRSMDPVIDTVRKNAKNFYKDVVNAMKKKQKEINTMRIRVIAFRDYKADGENAMLTTDFYTLPEQEDIFASAVDAIVADGGGDLPEDGLEALAYAIRSDWNKPADSQVKNRSIIVLWSDAETHPIGTNRGTPYYPENMARSFSELTDWWGCGQMPSPYINQNSKRLIIFAPHGTGWNDVADNWDNMVFFPSVEQRGLEEIDYEEILNAIVNSIGI